MNTATENPKTYTLAEWLKSEAIKVFESLFSQMVLLDDALRGGTNPHLRSFHVKKLLCGEQAPTSGLTPEDFFTELMKVLGISRWQDFAVARADANLLGEISKFNAECQEVRYKLASMAGPHTAALREHIERHSSAVWLQNVGELDRLHACWPETVAAKREARSKAVNLVLAIKNELKSRSVSYFARYTTDACDRKAQFAEKTAVTDVLAGRLPVDELPALLAQISATHASDRAQEREEKRMVRLGQNLACIPRKFNPEQHDPTRLPNIGAFNMVQDHFAKLAEQLGQEDWPAPLLQRNVVCFGSKGKAKTRALWCGLHKLMVADMVLPDEMDLEVVNAADLADEVIELARADADALRARINYLAGRDSTQNSDRFCQYLFIDDLSKAPLTERYGRELYKIVNARYEAGLPTYITTQDGPEDLVKAMARGDQDVEKKLAAIIRRLTQDGDALIVDFDADYDR